MSALRPDPGALAGVLADLVSLGVIGEQEADLARARGFRFFRHGDIEPVIYQHSDPKYGPPGARALTISASDDFYNLEEAHATHFSIRRWAHATVSVAGQLQGRLADQRKIGRQRAPGERSPVPLPDWYELTHLVYEHGAELGFEPTRAVWQYLPGSDEEGLNIAEALHLRQPR